MTVAPRRAFVVSALAQLALLLLHDLGRDPTGHPVHASAIAALAVQVPLYLVVLSLTTASWAIALRLTALPSQPTLGSAIRRAINVLWLAAHLVMLVLIVVDLGLQRFRGEPLAWHQFATYGGAGLLNSDWVQPVLDLWGTALVTLFIVALAAIALGRTRSVEVPSWRECLLWSMAVPLCWAPTQLAWYHQRDLMQPAVQRLWATRHPSAPLAPEAERADREMLRRLLDPTGRDRWLNDSFPLQRVRSAASRAPSWGAAQQEPPDIVVLAIESLRGRDAGWGDSPRTAATSLTPHLDSLARDAVRYPHWLAGGDPSPRGFVTLQTGAWEHGALFIVANFQQTHIDAFPLLLRARGYHSVALWSGTPSFDNQLTFARRWYDETLFDEAGAKRWYFQAVPEQVTVDRALGWLREHDRAHVGQPVLMYLATDATHTPFRLPDTVPDPGTRQGRYDEALRETDRQLGRLIAALRARPRWSRTVVLVVGDHGDRTEDPTPPDLRGMPTDAMVVTSAFLHGPRDLVGPARVDSSVVSHADWFPTVRSWFADTTASVWMGRDLMEPVTRAPWAVAIDSRGYRLDRDGHTLMVDATDSTRAWSWPSWRGEGSATAPVAAPFAASEPGQLMRAIRYWSMLVEQNRVVPPPR